MDTGRILPHSTVTFLRETSRACSDVGGPAYPSLYYVARVEPRTRLTVTAESTFIQPMVRLTEGCAGATRLATSTSPGSGRARASWTNTDTVAREVLVVVSVTSTIVEGTFDLTTAFDTPP